MNFGPWSDNPPTAPGKWAKKTPELKYPAIVDIVDADGQLFEFSKGQFWELRLARWARVIEP